MPLPAALAAKLAKRGIVPKEVEEPEEEVIAEDYDTNKTNDEVEGLDSRLDEFGNFLHEGWEKVWDPEYETWYYWDVSRDMVSWLPPSDLEAVITYPANSTKTHTEEKRENEPKRSKPKSKSRQVRWQKPAPADDEIDPMDPSSYSDAPVGDWRRGLKKLDDAKSGVDSTASGPLFQQRPYPSPGEVLKRNKQALSMTGPQKPQ
uniref:polyglutamine-binding protein 1-like n=1 Tax=Styela clava TaxID=7725 RepID=UPI00193A0F15|nr:polyglutamine-binding protein 1-like [Styela clava]